jgi:hypothetical protein
MEQALQDQLPWPGLPASPKFLLPDPLVSPASRVAPEWPVLRRPAWWLAERRLPRSFQAPLRPQRE